MKKIIPSRPPSQSPADTGPTQRPPLGKSRGGKITRVSGTPSGKDDGKIPVQRGEYVVRRSAVKKLGTAALAEVNRGKLPQGKKGSRTA